MENKFRIAEVNGLPFDALTGVFLQCLAVGRWVRELAAGRPYATTDELLSRADDLSASLTDDEIRRALADHPRIGQPAAPDSRTAALSAAEQSGVDIARLADRLATANAAYEARFGHIYLVCAAGRSGEDLLVNLTERMANDPVTELGVARRELGGIARLRLAGMISE
jgi:2-oxo-4-hydroxy-4-carboxy-5-ureidoimidazoline decarboxylase